MALWRYMRDPPEVPSSDCFITQLPLRAAMPSEEASTALESALPLLFSASNSPRLPPSMPADHRISAGAGGGGKGDNVVTDRGADAGDALPAASKADTAKLYDVPAESPLIATDVL